MSERPSGDFHTPHPLTLHPMRISAAADGEVHSMSDVVSRHPGQRSDLRITPVSISCCRV